MKVKGIKWLDAKMELTKISIEWSKIYVGTQKYQWKPEFLWSKKEVEEVVELMEKGFDLAREEYGIRVIIGGDNRVRLNELNETMSTLEREIWRLKTTRLAA